MSVSIVKQGLNQTLPQSREPTLVRPKTVSQPLSQVLQSQEQRRQEVAQHQAELASPPVTPAAGLPTDAEPQGADQAYAHATAAADRSSPEAKLAKLDAEVDQLAEQLKFLQAPPNRADYQDEKSYNEAVKQYSIRAFLFSQSCPEVVRQVVNAVNRLEKRGLSAAEQTEAETIKQAAESLAATLTVMLKDPPFLAAVHRGALFMMSHDRLPNGMPKPRIPPNF